MAPSTAPTPAEITAAVDLAVAAALKADVDPVENPFVSVEDVLREHGIPEAQRRSILLSACHAYESIMRQQRRDWESRGR